MYYIVYVHFAGVLKTFYAKMHQMERFKMSYYYSSQYTIQPVKNIWNVRCRNLWYQYFVTHHNYLSVSRANLTWTKSNVSGVKHSRLDCELWRIWKEAIYASFMIATYVSSQQ